LCLFTAKSHYEETLLKTFPSLFSSSRFCSDTKTVPRDIIALVTAAASKFWVYKVHMA
jgi:hypothetical protein